MSVWSTMQGVQEKYGSWPDPFANGVKKWEQLTCDGDLYFDIQFFLPFAGAYFFTTFVPTPTEIARKTVTGGYKCGFYLGIKFKSPLDIIWRNGDASRILGRIVRPFATTAFYLWATQAIWDGLSTWQSLIYKGYACEEDPMSCVTADGAANWAIEGDHVGAMPFGVDVWDPNDWHQGLGGVIEVPGAMYTTCRMFLDVTYEGATASDLTFVLHLGSEKPVTGDNAVSFAMGAGGQNSFALEASALTDGPDHWQCSMSVSGLHKDFPLGRIELRARYTIVRSNPEPVFQDCPPWIPGLPAV